MLLLTEDDVRQILHFAALSAANKLCISQAEAKTVSQLVAEIRVRHRGLADALQAYMDVYGEWYSFHVRIDWQGKQGRLDAQEEQELLHLIGLRQDTREAFLKALAEVPAGT